MNSNLEMIVADLNDAEIAEVDGGFLVAVGATAAALGLWYTSAQVGEMVGEAVN